MLLKPTIIRNNADYKLQYSYLFEALNLQSVCYYSVALIETEEIKTKMNCFILKASSNLLSWQAHEKGSLLDMLATAKLASNMASRRVHML